MKISEIVMSQNKIYPVGRVYKLVCDGTVYIYSSVCDLKTVLQMNTNKFKKWRITLLRCVKDFVDIRKAKMILIKEYTDITKNELNEKEIKHILKTDCINRPEVEAKLQEQKMKDDKNKQKEEKLKQKEEELKCKTKSGKYYCSLCNVEVCNLSDHQKTIKHANASNLTIDNA